MTPHVRIPEIEVNLFDLSIAIALFRQSRERLTRIGGILPRSKAVLADAPKPEDRKSGPLYGKREDGCLVVSFDAGWYPFLDDSRGYNRVRSYVPGNSLLDHVEEALKCQHRYPSGGRAFLHSTGALGANGVALVRWELATPSSYLQKIRSVEQGRQTRL